MKVSVALMVIVVLMRFKRKSRSHFFLYIGLNWFSCLFLKNTNKRFIIVQLTYSIFSFVQNWVWEALDGEYTYSEGDFQVVGLLEDSQAVWAGILVWAVDLLEGSLEVWGNNPVWGDSHEEVVDREDFWEPVEVADKGQVFEDGDSWDSVDAGLDVDSKEQEDWNSQEQAFGEEHQVEEELAQEQEVFRGES